MGILESINLFCIAIILISNKCEASVVDIEGYMKVKIKKIQSWLSAGGYEVWGLARLIILRIWELIDSKTQRASLFYPAPTALADIHAGIWTSYQPAANLGNTEKVTKRWLYHFIEGSSVGPIKDMEGCYMLIQPPSMAAAATRLLIYISDCSLPTFDVYWFYPIA